MMRSALQKSGAYASKAVTKPRSIGSVRGMAKEIKFGVDGRAAMLTGVDTLADAVQVRDPIAPNDLHFPCLDLVPEGTLSILRQAQIFWEEISPYFQLTVEAFWSLISCL